MIYTCQICGAGFKKEQLEPAIKSKAKFITCNYCGYDNELASIEASPITKGYDRLESADFFYASLHFLEATKEVDMLDNDSLAKRKYIEAYLGQALAQFFVQVIYDEYSGDPYEPLEINCFKCNENYFVDSHDYQTALSIASYIPDSELRVATIANLNRFAKKIDGIKEVYDKKASQNTKYRLFIACDDNNLSSLNVAYKVKNELPDMIKSESVFINDPDLFTEETYEAEILYAIHNSDCMLVVVDDAISSRLMNIYYRFCEVILSNSNLCDRQELLFVRYKGNSEIVLPFSNLAKHVFELDQINEYHSFLCDEKYIV